MRSPIVLFVVLMSLPSLAAAADTPISLSLNEAIRMAVEKNLDVRAELYNPAQLEADINRNRAIYDPLLTLQTSYSDSTVPSTATGSTSSSYGRTYQADASLAQLFWTGATATAGFNNNYNSTNSIGTLSNYWESTLGLTVTQPLLKNFGRENTDININVSRLSKFASLEHFNTVLLNTVTQVRTEYFKLYSLREQLQVASTSLELARKILSDTKAQVAAGVLPAMEITNAEFGVYSREKDLIDAERAVSDEVDVLRLLLQIKGKGDIVTVDQPRHDAYAVNENTSLKRAMDRPDIKELRRNLDIAELQTRIYNNKVQPDLSFAASASLVGLNHTYPRNLETLSSADNPAWSLGLTFTYPLGNNAAENDYRKSRLKTEQTAVQIRSLEENAANDVKSAIRGITSTYKQIAVAERGRAYAEERLKAYLRRKDVGLATNKDVLDVENDLVAAKNNQIAAVVNYDNAITHLWQVTGELLERQGIRVVEDDADKLYKNIR
ncbi:TolC family protein [Geobacter sp. AOG2]|uniref:TolC family protein n=1 Tax=Geobacter sp. AOG2 TaxID=1566347 RepID=UPI001CC475B1|nr:TolC family protein [Geobacter sp. AOG2]GFE60866.1 RND transporter [Geobacter sp. AOG2]